MFHFTTPAYCPTRPITDDTIHIGLKLLMCTDDIDRILSNQERFLNEITDAIDNLNFINCSVDRTCSLKRSFSNDMNIHYGTTYNTRSPLEELINELMNLKLTLAHSRSADIYTRLTRDLDEIIKRSNIEYDISMAYLFKVMLKETLIKGKHITVCSDHERLYDDSTTETTYRYTWRDKFIVTCYVLGHIPYTRAALLRARSMNQLKYGRADLASALQHPRRLLSEYNTYTIALDSINMKYGCI